MNSAKTAIMVDSGCDISQEFIEQYDIKVLRLKVLYGGDRMYSDGLDIDPLEVYRRFPQEIPTTSTPNMYEVSELVNEIKSEGYEKIIGITISSGLSGTYNAVAMAFEEEDIETFAFDTKNISIGAGLLAMWAAKKLSEGWTFEAVKHGLNDKINDSKVFFYMDTLDYLRKGGRISPAVAIVGKALNLKPIISCNEKGTYYTVSKIRGQHKGLEKLMDSLKDYIGDKKAYLAIMNGDGTRYLDIIRARIKEMFPQCEVVVDKQITATMAIHTGPGLIGVGVLFE